MASEIINQIEAFETYKFDKKNNRVINLRSKEATDIDEFLNIQHLLDNNRVLHKFEKNFEIQIIE